MANFGRMLDLSAKTEGGPSAAAKVAPGQQQQQRPDDEPDDLVLYVWGAEEKSSRAAFRLAQELSLLDKLHVVDVRELPMKEIPSWLTGVPTLLSVDQKMIWEGTDCLDQIEEIAEYQAVSLPAGLKQGHAAALHNNQPMRAQHPLEVPSMRQTMEDGTVIQQRMAQMPRGYDEMAQQPNDQQHAPPPNSDTKISASDMKGEVDAILQRRQMLFQQQQPGGPQGRGAHPPPSGGRGPPLPSMDHRA